MKLSKVYNLVLIVLLGLYPFLIYFGFKFYSEQNTVFIIIGLLLVRVIFFTKNRGELSQIISRVIILFCGMMILGIVLKNYSLIQLYPVMMNIGLGLFFTLSLGKNKTPVIETLARIKEKSLPESAVVYTRKVTKAWVFFFWVNGIISLYTYFLNNLEIWTLYNGFISYLLIGLMFGGEYLFRIKEKNKWN